MDTIDLTDDTLDPEERPERNVRRAELHLQALVPNAPLRFKVEAVDRLRAADTHLAAMRHIREEAE